MKESDFLKLLKTQSHKTGYNNWGFDCATLPPPFDQLHISTDQFIEGTHFDLSFMSLKSIGWKATASALSDLAASGSSPIGIMASICWPKKSDESINDLFLGISDCCQSFKCQWMGGDISRHQSQHFIDISVIGKSDYNQSNFSPSEGDLIVTTGPLGLAKAGLQTARSGVDSILTKKFLYPEPKIELGQSIVKKFNPTTMTDISDGLYKEINSLSKKFNIGFNLELTSKLLSPELLTYANNDLFKARDLYLSGGDDYELLFTCAPKNLKTLVNDGFIILGSLTKSAPSYSLDGCLFKPDPRLGWDSFTET